MAKRKKDEERTERLICPNHNPSAIFDVVMNEDNEVSEVCPICKTNAYTCYYSGDKSPNVRTIRKQEREERKALIAARLEGKIYKA